MKYATHATLHSWLDGYAETTTLVSISTLSLSTNRAPTIMVAAGLTSPGSDSLNALPTAYMSFCSVTNIRARAMPPLFSLEVRDGADDLFEDDECLAIS